MAAAFHARRRSKLRPRLALRPPPLCCTSLSRYFSCHAARHHARAYPACLSLHTLRRTVATTSAWGRPSHWPVLALQRQAGAAWHDLRRRAAWRGGGRLRSSGLKKSAVKACAKVWRAMHFGKPSFFLVHNVGHDCVREHTHRSGQTQERGLASFSVTGYILGRVGPPPRFEPSASSRHP